LRKIEAMLDALTTTFLVVAGIAVLFMVLGVLTVIFEKFILGRKTKQNGKLKPRKSKNIP
jgi:hypothetical protein